MQLWAALIVISVFFLNKKETEDMKLRGREGVLGGLERKERNSQEVCWYYKVRQGQAPDVF